jgi:hypothetical protein
MVRRAMRIKFGCRVSHGLAGTKQNGVQLSRDDKTAGRRLTETKKENEARNEKPPMQGGSFGE